MKFQNPSIHGSKVTKGIKKCDIRTNEQAESNMPHQFFQCWRHNKSDYQRHEPQHEKTCFCHMRTTKALISTFVVRCLDSTIPILAIPKISRLASF